MGRSSYLCRPAGCGLRMVGRLRRPSVQVRVLVSLFHPGRGEAPPYAIGGCRINPIFGWVKIIVLLMSQWPRSYFTCAWRIANHAAMSGSNSPHTATALAPPGRRRFAIVVRRSPKRMNRSLLEGKRRVPRPRGQAFRIAGFQTQIGIRHPQVRQITTDGIYVRDTCFNCP